jgi:ADP-ribosyl-[dinitrogen reductase] hydrolase
MRVLRVHPVGLSYAHDSDGLKKAARLSCRITHNNTEAIAGTKVAAYVVARLANPDYVLDVKELIKEAVEVAKEDNVLVANKITRIHDYLFLNTEDSLETLGTSSRTIDTVPAALYCFLKTPADTEQTVVSAVNVEGDSDSIGAIAGAFSGAYNGIDSIPQRWLDGLQQKQEIINAAQKLYDAVNA